ncbi:Eco57I restriction-modification methylase domain-containing protein [Patescibacteria group bacterium]|nr:Eco57I restriction-modification methylase domain-containing protein [Patescibacteria group bacterium]
MNLQKKYNQEEFIGFLKSFVPNYTKDIRPIDISGLKATKNAYYLGECLELELAIFELTHITSREARVALASDGFKIMKHSESYRALVVYQAAKGDDWRLSLMTATPDINQKGKIVQTFSNPRRLSFFLGPDAKTYTPEKYLIKLGRVKDVEDLKTRFSVEVVNRDFYNSISGLFTKLAGGKRTIGKDKFEGEGSLQLPSTSDHRKKQEFATRLLGRIIFCWFLKKKKSSQGKSLILDSLLSSQSLLKVSNYYHDVLEPLFFQQLNTPKKQRRDEYKDSSVPFLNGGLFQPHNDDFYDITDFHGFSKYHNTLRVPNTWFKELFKVLETYNFTIDESTSVDIDLSIDPEMLGKIFENLLAEVNPETGETARKATGSYYTPRSIVEYMVDESLKHYLAGKTGIDLDRLAAILSYDKDLPKLSQQENNLLIESVYDLKIIDPACGSGAFPMGILQKVVLILQKVDPDCRMWLDKQISRIEDTYLHKILEEKLKNENLDYIRKLGIVQNTVYGVDIQPIAVEIVRLRFFLSLVVDEDVDDNKKNRGLQPLPNLEFKFICANSLIELDDPFQNGFLKDKFFDAFEILSKNYFAASDPQKKQDLKRGLEILIKQKLDDSVSKWSSLTKTYITDARFKKQLKQKHAKQISSLSYEAALWESYLNIFNDEPVAFFNTKYFFPEVKDGFDIAIANPPYIGESGHKEIFRNLRKNPWVKKYYRGKMDIFYFFFHRSLDLLKDKGILSFISTNYYVTAAGAVKLRKDFHDRASILHLINFNELKIFPSALGQHNMITILKKGKYDIEAKNCITNQVGIANHGVLYSIVNFQDELSDYFDVKQNDLYDTDRFYIRIRGALIQGDNKIGKILCKMQSSGISLGVICNINQGIVSGCDYVSGRNISKLGNVGNVKKGDGIFVLDLKNKRDRRCIESFSEKEKQLLRPFFKNSDIKRYWCKTDPEKLLIYYENKLDSNAYPNLYAHLCKFQNILKERLETYQEKYHWTALHRARKELIFVKPKIVVPYRSKINCFAYSEDEWFCRSDSYVITEKDKTYKVKYILALLSSKLYYLWLYFKGKRKGDVLELFQIPLSEISIKQAASKEQDLFIENVNKILSFTQTTDYLQNQSKQQKVQECQKQIDKMVYELYGLTNEEMKIVDNFNRKGD